MRLLRPLAPGLAALALAVPAAGGVTTPDGKISAEATVAWPENLSKGWFPIHFELRSEDTRPHRIELVAELSAWSVRQSPFRRTLELGPGERLATDLLVPAFGNELPTGHGFFTIAAAYDARVVVDGRDVVALGSPGSLGGGAGFQVSKLLLLTPDGPSASELATWQDAVAQEIRITRGAVPVPVPVSPGGTLTMLGYPAGATSSKGIPDVLSSGASFDRAPPRPEAYTSLDLVVLEVRGGDRPPPADLLDALAAYARLGGRLAVVGTGASALVQATPALAGWTEERFRAPVSSPPGTFAIGFGLLAVDDRAAERDEIVQLRPLLEDPDPIVPRASGSGPRVSRWVPPLPGYARLPYRTLAFVLVLFAVLIGPVNFRMVKRSGRQVLLLVTIPAIAVLATVALVGYGLFQQGLAVKTSSLAVSLLDQRAHRGATLELQTFYAGITPGAGLRPEPGTCVLPELAADLDQRPTDFRATDGVLSGGFLPVRSLVHQTVLSERAARGRLQLVAGKGGLRAENGLGARIERLYVRDADGGEHVAVAAIPAGESVPLEDQVELWLVDYDATRKGPGAIAMVGSRLSANPFARLYGELGPMGGGRYFAAAGELGTETWRRVVRLLRQTLPPGTYAALVSEPLLADPLGLHARELAGRTWIIGVLDPEDVR